MKTIGRETVLPQIASGWQRELIRLLSTFFYAGYLPIAPGTWGSLASLGLYALFRGHSSVQLVFIILSFIGGVGIAFEAERLFERRDSGRIVIDEVVGMQIALFGLDVGWPLAFFAFFIFRLLDILKPFPAGWSQGLRGGWGVMADDVVAGVYAHLIISALMGLFGLRSS